MIRKVSAEDIAIRGNGTGLEYMCPTRHFVYIFFNPVFQVSTAKNEINLFNNHVLIVAPVTFAPAGAMTPSAEFLYIVKLEFTGVYIIFLISAQKHRLWVLIRTASLPHRGSSNEYPQSLFWAEIWKISDFFLSWNFQFLEVKFSVYLSKCVFVMLRPRSAWLSIRAFVDHWYVQHYFSDSSVSKL